MMSESQSAVPEGLTLASTVRMSTGTALGGTGCVLHAQTILTTKTPGYDMPRLGFGVYQNYTTQDSVLEAFRVGYR